MFMPDSAFGIPVGRSHASSGAGMVLGSTCGARLNRRIPTEIVQYSYAARSAGTRFSLTTPGIAQVSLSGRRSRPAAERCGFSSRQHPSDLGLGIGEVFRQPRNSLSPGFLLGTLGNDAGRRFGTGVNAWARGDYLGLQALLIGADGTAEFVRKGA